MFLSKTIEITKFVDIIGGNLNSSPLISSGDRIKVTTPPGCWGAMITPSIRSGHEVSEPVFVEGAEIGDAIALHIEKVAVISKYASSGTGKRIEGRFKQDPTVNAICPTCQTQNPITKVIGIGDGGIVCANCGKPIIPQTLSNGYTIAFDENKTIGATVSKFAAEKIAERVFKGDEKLPKGSTQHLVTLLAKSDFYGTPTRIAPMIGNIGCVPKHPMPSSRNCLDMHASLISNPEFSHITKEDINDAHMDLKTVVEGSVVLSPVKVPGGGVYVGDVHSIQGNGELAKHTVDVIADVMVRVELIKGLAIDGPIVIPTLKEIDYRFIPLDATEKEVLNQVLIDLGDQPIEEHYPLQFVGSGSDLNQGINNAVERISRLTGLPEEEVMNRATISGEVGIGRTSGLVYITLLLPQSQLQRMNILQLVESHYKSTR